MNNFHEDTPKKGTTGTVTAPRQGHEKLYDCTVYDREGKQIGIVEGVCIAGNNTAEWVTVTLKGNGGGKETLIPLRNAAIQDNNIYIPFDSTKVEKAPTVAPGGKLDGREAEMYGYYGIPFNKKDEGGKQPQGKGKEDNKQMSNVQVDPTLGPTGVTPTGLDVDASTLTYVKKGEELKGGEKMTGGNVGQGGQSGQGGGQRKGGEPGMGKPKPGLGKSTMGTYQTQPGNPDEQEWQNKGQQDWPYGGNQR